MPRCNLTLKQKSQMIELSGELTTVQLAKKFRVHPTTVTRTLRKRHKIQDQVTRVNPNFKTVQTNLKSEEHDTLVLKYINNKQEANELITVSDICDKAIEIAENLGRHIKSRRAWWRRFKVRCNIIKSRVVKGSIGIKSQSRADCNDSDPGQEQGQEPKQRTKIKKQKQTPKQGSQPIRAIKQKSARKKDLIKPNKCANGRSTKEKSTAQGHSPVIDGKSWPTLKIDEPPKHANVSTQQPSRTAPIKINLPEAMTKPK